METKIDNCVSAAGGVKPSLFKPYLVVSGLVLSVLSACTIAPSRPTPNEKVVRPVPFEARSPIGTPQIRPRVLVLGSSSNPTMVPEPWVQKAEAELWRQLELSGAFVLLKPDEVGIDPKDFQDRHQWDWKKVLQVAREKSIPVVMDWELLPIRVQQDADPVGIVRQRRRLATVEVKARLMDSRKGNEIASEVGSAQQQDRDILWLSKTENKVTEADYDALTLEYLLKSAVENLIPELLVHLPKTTWTGRVAMIKGDRLYLNVGRQSGLQVGDVLKVLDVGDEVFDPETGDSIGKVPGRMKGTLEVISYFGQDGSVAVVHSGAGFQENDSIEYY